jgi:hypothetical protein
MALGDGPFDECIELFVGHEKTVIVHSS